MSDALLKAEARMGNDIARHIETFWDPRMRRGLEALVAEGSDDLDPLLVDAAGRLATHATRSEPEAQP